MGILKDFVQRYKQNKERYKDAEVELNIHKKLQERQKNANERELERYLEEQRQKHIENELHKFRKKKQNDMWKSNMLKSNNKLFNDCSAMKSKRVRLGVVRY